MINKKQLMENSLVVPVWKKYSLNFKEAAEYFGIGEKRLRNIVASNLSAGFTLEVGSFIRIKRAKFEEFLDLTDAV